MSRRGFVPRIDDREEVISIDANRSLVCLTSHQPWSMYGVYADTTASWYYLRYEATTPTWAFASDPDFEREVGDLYRRDRIGEPLGGEVTT